MVRLWEEPSFWLADGLLVSSCDGERVLFGISSYKDINPTRSGP